MRLDVFQFTLHSLKVTGLCWTLQPNVDQLARKAWSHHRSREAGDKMVAPAPATPSVYSNLAPPP